MPLFIALLLIFSAALGWVGLTSHSSVREQDVSHRPIQVPEDGYASSQACRACHPSQYATWHGSYHRTMTQVATPESVVANFDAVTVADVHGRPMRLQQDGDRFFAEFDDPDWNGEGSAPPRINREVVMITGSHHQQIYWYATGRDRLLGQLPGAYLLDEQRWIPRRMAVLHPPNDPVFSETGHWNGTCIACHATHGKPEFDTPFGSEPLETQVVETTAAEFGIACEACHGPGEEHVRLNRSPMRRYSLHMDDRPDETTVQPGRLASQVSSQVCGQCHGIWEFYDRQGERQANSGGLPYRPGRELAETRFMAQPTRNAESPAMQALLADDAGFVRDSFWSDGMVRVTGREYNGLIESPCFMRATTEERKLSCFSCHTMHQTPDDPRPIGEWAVDQLAPEAQGDGACLQCHETFREDIPSHTRHASGSSGSQCYNCHMPFTTYGLLKTIRSHTVSSPTATESVETGRPNACNLCHLDKTLEWTASELERWFGTPKPALSADEQSVAASVLWLLRGDAGQRAIVAQAMAWPPAQEASGTAWMPPYLVQLLDDPYDAVRFGGARSLRALPGFERFPFDFIAPPRQRRDAQLAAMNLWDRAGRAGAVARPPLLLDERGALRVDEVLRIMRERNQRRMLLRE